MEQVQELAVQKEALMLSVGGHSSLNENVLHKFRCLNIWFLVGSTVLGEVRRCGHAGGSSSLGMGF